MNYSITTHQNLTVHPDNHQEEQNDRFHQRREHLLFKSFVRRVVKAPKSTSEPEGFRGATGDLDHLSNGFIRSRLRTTPSQTRPSTFAFIRNGHRNISRLSSSLTRFALAVPVPFRYFYRWRFHCIRYNRCFRIFF